MNDTWLNPTIFAPLHARTVDRWQSGVLGRFGVAFGATLLWLFLVRCPGFVFG